MPGASTFSRVFQEFAESELPTRIHKALIKNCCGNEIVGHISRDSTAIEAREAVAKTEKEGEGFHGAETSAGDGGMVDVLPKESNVGCKRNTRGCRQYRVGRKIPVNVADGSVPTSCIGTPDCVHDSQAAIPLTKMTAGRVLAVLYALMDSAYDVKQIHEHMEELGQVPIMDSHPCCHGKAARNQENKAACRWVHASRVRMVSGTHLRTAQGGVWLLEPAGSGESEDDVPHDIWRACAHGELPSSLDRVDPGSWVGFFGIQTFAATGVIEQVCPAYTSKENIRSDLPFWERIPHNFAKQQCSSQNSMTPKIFLQEAL